MNRVMKALAGRKRTACAVCLWVLAAAVLALGMMMPVADPAMRYMARCLIYACAGMMMILGALAALPGEKLCSGCRPFILFVAAFGLPYVFSILPLSAPDEFYHFGATVTLASQWLHGDALIDPAYLSVEGFVPHQNTAETAAAVMNGLFSEPLTGELVNMAEYCDGLYLKHAAYSVVYLPQAAGAALAMLLGLNRMGLYILADLCNLLCYAALVCLAVRLMPRWKTLMSMVAALPMALQQAASMSCDGMINGLAFLLIAQIMRLAVRRERITWRNVTPLVLTAVLLAPAKVVYACMLLMLLILPMDCYRSRKQKWLFLVGTCVAAGCAVLVFQLGNILVTAAGGAEAAAGHMERFTLAYALGHPAALARLIVRTHTPNYLYWLAETAVGRELSGLSLQLYHGDAWCLWMLLLFTAVAVPEGQPVLRGRDRLILVATVVLVYLGITASMLFAWTNVGDTVIQGVQGRYFLPVLPLALLALQGGNVRLKKDRTPWVIGLYALMHVVMMMEIVVLTLEL